MADVGNPLEPEGTAEAVAASTAAGRLQIRGGSMLLFGYVASVGLGLAARILLVRSLSKSGYGALALAMSIKGLILPVSSLGLQRTVTALLPQYEEKGRIDIAHGILRAATIGSFFTGLSIAIAGIAITVVVAPNTVTGGFADLLLIFLLLVPIQSMQTVLDQAFATFSRPGLIVIRRHIFTPVMQLAVVIFLSLTDANVRVIPIGYLFIDVVGSAVSSAILMRHLRNTGFRDRARRLTYPIREMLRFSLPLLTTEVSIAIWGNAPSLLLGLVAGPVAVAPLAAAISLASAMIYVGTSFTVLFSPLAARLHARGDSQDELNRLYWQAAAWTTVLTVPLLIAEIGFAPQLMGFLFGERYVDAADSLRILAVGMFLNGAIGPNHALLTVYRDVRYLLGVNLVGAILNIVVGAVLVLTGQTIGAAMALTLSSVGYNSAWQLRIARLTSVDAFDSRCARMFIAVAVLTAAAFAVGSMTSLSIVAVAAAAAVAFVIVLSTALEPMSIPEVFPGVRRLPLIGDLLTPRRGSR